MVEEALRELKRLLQEQEWRLLRSEVRSKTLRKIALDLIGALQEAGVNRFKSYQLEDLRNSLLEMQIRDQEGLEVGD